MPAPNLNESALRGARLPGLADPEDARADTCERYLAALAHLIGDGSADRRFAATVTALMIGFGDSVRTLGLFGAWTSDELVAHYGAIVKAQIDACATAT